MTTHENKCCEKCVNYASDKDDQNCPCHTPAVAPEIHSEITYGKTRPNFTTKPLSPEVVESWRRKAHDLMIDMGGQERQELLHYISSLLTSQKQKQIEEIVGIAEGMKQEEHSHKVCENFSDCEMFTRHTRSHNQALDDFITKIQAK